LFPKLVCSTTSRAKPLFASSPSLCIELLIIGKGESNSLPLAPDIIRHFQAHKIAVEHMSTIHATATYNVLTAEERVVAAALLTPNPVADEIGEVASIMREYVPQKDEDVFRITDSTENKEERGVKAIEGPKR